LKGKILFPEDMNDDCIEFIKNTLIINPQKRFSAKELLDLDFLSTKRL